MAAVSRSGWGTFVQCKERNNKLRNSWTIGRETCLHALQSRGRLPGQQCLKADNPQIIKAGYHVTTWPQCLRPIKTTWEDHHNTGIDRMTITTARARKRLYDLRGMVVSKPKPDRWCLLRLNRGSGVTLN
ncbi:hypothetical protein PG985_004185 [Apiospora marii]|uniref:uncharacterized protein n=1 Tax=Apiospora marii TaxID=335849 RepID=UPI003131983A